MAAHIKTYFEQVLEVKDFDIKQFEMYHQAISYAKLGDNLEVDDWETLYNEDEPESFVEKVKGMQEKYIKIWEELGCPTTAEKWIEARAYVYMQSKKEEPEDLI